MATPAASSTPEQSAAALQNLLDGPAGVPPAGVTPNFNSSQNQDLALYVMASMTVSFATFAVVIRIYTKHFLLRSTGREDYTSILAWMSFIGFTIPALMCHTAGAGHHMWDLQLKSFFRVLYWVNLTAITYAVTITFVKLSILLQYLRIFAPTRQGNLPLFVAIYACIWSLVLFYTVDTLFLIFLCNPREKISNPLMTTGHCFDGNASYKASGVFNVLSDFAILIIPLPRLWNLQMPLRKKMMLTAVFATGFFACVTSILRTYYTWKVVETDDTSWELVPMGHWTWAELSIGIIVGCLPSMPKFFQHFGHKVHQSIHGAASEREASSSTDTPSKGNVFARAKGSFAKYGVTISVSRVPNYDSYRPRPQLHDEYLTLDEFDPPLHRERTTVTPIEHPCQNPATSGGDLEYGKQGA